MKAIAWDESLMARTARETLYVIGFILNFHHHLCGWNEFCTSCTCAARSVEPGNEIWQDLKETVKRNQGMNSQCRCPRVLRGKRNGLWDRLRANVFFSSFWHFFYEIIKRRSLVCLGMGQWLEISWKTGNFATCWNLVYILSCASLDMGKIFGRGIPT